MSRPGLLKETPAGPSIRGGERSAERLWVFQFHTPARKSRSWVYREANLCGPSPHHERAENHLAPALTAFSQSPAALDADVSKTAGRETSYLARLRVESQAGRINQIQR